MAGVLISIAQYRLNRGRDDWLALWLDNEELGEGLRGGV